MINKPDYDRAATAAMQLLVDRSVSETPVHSMNILLSYPHVRVIPYISAAKQAGMDRKELVPLFGNQDAALFKLHMPDDPEMKDVDYVVFYNMFLPSEVVRRAIARELGHIVLGHDGMTRSMEARMEEAHCFAHHLLTPRPIIHMLQQSGMPVTINMLVETTGCSESCVDEMQSIPSASVPADLNRQVSSLFAPHIMEYIEFHRHSAKCDHSPVVDFGSYMNGYKE